METSEVHLVQEFHNWKRYRGKIGYCLLLSKAELLLMNQIWVTKHRFGILSLLYIGEGVIDVENNTGKVQKT